MRANLATLLGTVAATVPDQVALVHVDRRPTWRELEERAARLATALRAAGVGAGDRVGIGLWSCPEYVEAILAICRIDAVPFNINYRYRADELAHIVRDSEARAIVTDATNSAVVDEALALAERAPLVVEVGAGGGHTAYESLIADHEPFTGTPSEDGLWMLYTGGTTGAPKAVVSTHAAIWRTLIPSGVGKFAYAVPDSLDELAGYVREHSADGPIMITYSAAPLIHGTGIYSTLGALVAGGRVVLPTSKHFSPAELLELCGREQVTDLVIVGDVFARPLVNELDRAATTGEPYDLAALQRISSIGAVFSAEAKAGVLRHCDATISDIVVASEGGPFALAVTTRGGDGVATRFMLAPGARLLDLEDRDVVPGSGEVGVLAAPADPDVGYSRAGSDTYREIDGQRWCVPGDMATLEADGTLVFQGRGSRVINTGGEKVFAEEVETVITSHPDVVDVLVVGVPDERYGSAVAAVVTVRDGSDLDAEGLRAHVGERLSDYKKPRRVVFVPEVRRTPVGKADLAWARQTAADAD